MILDSDVLIWFLRRETTAKHLIDSSENRAISVVSLMELLQGAKSKHEMMLIRSLIADTGFRVLPLEESIGEAALVLIEEHASSNGLQLADALIAATAIKAGEVLATGNVRHFRPIRALHVKPFHPQRH